MARFPNIVAAAAAVVIVTTAYAHAAPKSLEIAAPQGETLTLQSAKTLVGQQLASAGQRSLRPGSATFDEAGNVSVELIGQQGLPMGHVVVHPNNGAVTDAHAASKTGTNG